MEWKKTEVADAFVASAASSGYRFRVYGTGDGYVLYASHNGKMLSDHGIIETSSFLKAQLEAERIAQQSDEWERQAK